MAAVKIVVLYPVPADVEAFERAYAEEHAPMVTPQAFPGITRFVAARVLGTPDGSPPPFHRVAELHFPSMAVLQAAVASGPAQAVAAHTVAISTGGMPVVLVSDEESRAF